MFSKTINSFTIMNLFFISIFFASCSKSSKNDDSSQAHEAELRNALSGDLADLGIYGNEFSPEGNAKLLEYKRPYTFKDNDTVADAKTLSPLTKKNYAEEFKKEGSDVIDFKKAQADPENAQRTQDAEAHVNAQLKTMSGSSLGEVKDGRVTIVPGDEKTRSDMKVLSLMSKRIKSYPTNDSKNFSEFLSQDNAGIHKVRGAGFFSWVSKAASKVSKAFSVAAKAVQKSFVNLYYDAKKVANMAAHEIYNVAHTRHSFYEKEKPYFQEAANLIKIFPSGTLTFVGSELVMDALGGPAGLAAFPSQLAGFFNLHKKEMAVNFEHLVSYEVLKYATKAGQRLCFRYIPKDDPSASESDKDKNFEAFREENPGACSAIKYGIKALETVTNIVSFIGGDTTGTSLCKVAQNNLCNSMKDLNFISDVSKCNAQSNDAMTMDEYIRSFIKDNKALSGVVEKGEAAVSKNAKLESIWKESRVVYNDICKGVNKAAEFMSCDIKRRSLCLEIEKKIIADNKTRAANNEELIHFDEVECALSNPEELVKDYGSSYQTFADEIKKECSA